MSILFCLVFISHGILPILPHRDVWIVTIVAEILTHLPACVFLDVLVGNRPVQVVLTYFVVEYTSIGIDWFARVVQATVMHYPLILLLLLFLLLLLLLLLLLILLLLVLLLILLLLLFQKHVVHADVIVIPLSCSCSIQSIVAAPS